MKRRRFLVSSLAASALAGAPHSNEADAAQSTPAAAEREFYELRKYQLRRGPQTQGIDQYLREAAIPALNRAGIKPVGVFNTTIGPGNPAVYVLMPHPSIDSVATLHARLLHDPEYVRAGAAFINASATEPSYVRVESLLLASFATVPKLEVPPGATEHQPRIFELRTYESHSKKANLTKIEMFNRWEIAIFRRTGLRPVFFGEALIGMGMPSLTYMLTFANMEERMRNWAAFAGDPEWKKLSHTPGYTDPEIVCNITNFILTPTAYSQV